jgi:sucrose-6-phosphate hydrolase SacC (GH32 family)
MKSLLVAWFFCCWGAVLARAADGSGANEILFADFEGDTWGEWQATGQAFGAGPARGALPNQMPVTGFAGRGLVNSYVGGDRSTGTLTSAEFTITKPYLNFLIGGGNHTGKVGINLLIDGQVARSATGTEFERLSWHTWNLFAVQKKKARLQIVDQHTGGWGHVNIDQITMSDRPKVPPYFNDAVTRAMASVAEATPRATNDPTRPIYHFLAPANWMNDPNGPIYHRDYYHIYYQHNPFGDQWGHMHWGHARSRDLVSWKHLPISLWPSKEAGEDHVFSGCATTNSQGEFLAFYTSIGFGKSAGDYAEQWVAVGDSEGNTFKKHPANPVLSEKLHGEVKVYDWRDPFVFRDGGKTYLVCGGNLNRGKGGQAVVLLYEARDGKLIDWTYRGVLFTHPDSAVKNIECPNFFKLGDRWVLIISPHDKVQYFTGTFDPVAGKFTAQQRGLMDQSGDYYAPNCMEDPQGRRILWGWVRGFKEGRGWNGCLTLARVLAMGADGRVQQAPATELQKLRGQLFDLSATTIVNATNYLENLRGDALEIEAALDLSEARNVGLLLRASKDGAKAVTVSYDGNELSVAGVKTRLGVPAKEKTLKLHLFLDKSVLEVYANGELCFTRVIYPGEHDLGLGLFASGGSAKVTSFQAWPLKTIW